MNILFFAPDFEHSDVKKVLSTVRGSFPDVKIQSFTDCQTMFDWLRIPPRSFFVAILLPDSHQTLTQLVSMRGLFMDRKIILSLPDDAPRSIALSHKLNPLYFLSASDDKEGMVCVMKKLLIDVNESGMRVEKRAKSPC